VQVKKEALPPRPHQGPAYDGTCCLSQSLGIEGECVLLLLFFTSYHARYYSSSFLAPAFGLEGGTAPSLVSTGGTIILVSLSLFLSLSYRYSERARLAPCHNKFLPARSNSC